MFKKIHSNRNPEDTVYSELKKEFAVYFGKAGNCTKAIAGRYPNFLFGVMVFLMAISIGLSFTILRRHDAVKKKPPKYSGRPVEDGFAEIGQAASALKQTIRLKKQVDSITAKKTLNKTDSATLITDLDQLKVITQPSNEKKK